MYWCGVQPYLSVWHAMQQFTKLRFGRTERDQIWVLEHEPVFTLGQAGRDEHVLSPGDIPVIRVDRGGQVTYHGLGQLVVYPLLDLARLGCGVREYVHALEQTILSTLALYGIAAHRISGAPGVYVDGAKIAALGVRVSHGCCFHGLALNVSPDLSAFARINPCGYAGMPVTSMLKLGLGHVTSLNIYPVLLEQLGYALQIRMEPRNGLPPYYASQL